MGPRIFLWRKDSDGGAELPPYLLLIRYANALHFIPLGGPPGPRSRSKHSLAPIRLYLR